MEHLIDPNWSTTHFEVLQILGVIGDKLRGSEVEKIQALNRVYESAVNSGFSYSALGYMLNDEMAIDINSDAFLTRVQEEMDRAIPQQAKLIDFEESGKYE